MAWTEKFAVWSDDGPYFVARRDTELGAEEYIESNQPSMEPTQLYVMIERWYEEETP